MKNICLVPIILLFYTTLFAQFSPLFSLEFRDEIDKIIYFDTEISYAHTPGFIIGIVVQDSSFIYSYGTITKDSLVKPKNNTLFEVGGMTKVFTASLVQLLVEEGKMHYDSCLNNYFPEKYRNPLTKDLKIIDLITHTSGLPRMPLEFGTKELEDNNPYAHYSAKDLMDFYKDYYFDKKTKKEYLHSHVNFALLEKAIECTTKVSYEKNLIANILHPAGMKDSGFFLSKEQQSRLAQGYSIAGKETPFWKFQSFKGSEGLKTSVEDLLEFAKLQLGQKNIDLYQSLKPTHEIYCKTGVTKFARMAKGWHVLKNKKYHDVVAHSGTTSGHRSFIGFVKETQTAVIVLSNSEHGMGGLGYLILRMMNNNWKKKRK